MFALTLRLVFGRYKYLKAGKFKGINALAKKLPRSM